MTKENIKAFEITARTIFEKQGAIGFHAFIDNFFNSNVCIPKGENRHPYADVLHEWIEGAEMQIDGSDVPNVLEDFSHRGIYRVKPSEPVYEWQWFEIYNGTVVDYTTVWYIEEEMSDENQWLKIEETKRVRKETK